MTDETYGKRICERMNVCVCKTESHCGTEKIITLSINYTSIKLEKKLEKKMKLRLREIECRVWCGEQH